MGYEVFCDLKFHDIPTTVERAARVVGALGATYLNFHAQGGAAMLTAGVDGFLAGAQSAGLPTPVPLAVTILTSDDQAPAHILQKRVQTALEAGAAASCARRPTCTRRSSTDRASPRSCPASVRPARATHDQARAATPEEAIDAGADVLVIGRAVTHADDPAAAASAVAESIARVA